MNLIKRCATIETFFNAAAGVYLGTDTTIVTAQFNLFLESIAFSFYSYDAVTSQAIAAYVYLRPGIPYTVDNPGLRSTADGSERAIDIEAGHPFNYVTLFNWSAGASITTSIVAYLTAVTANIINFRFHATYYYLCPEDYLSTEPFKV